MRQHKKNLFSWYHHHPHPMRRWMKFFRQDQKPQPAPIPPGVSDTSLLPLNELKTGRRGIVRHLHGGRHFMSRIYELGFLPGSEIIMLENYGHGPVLVAVRGTRIALGNREAARIYIEVLDEAGEE